MEVMSSGNGQSGGQSAWDTQEYLWLFKPDDQGSFLTSVTVSQIRLNS